MSHDLEKQQRYQAGSNIHRKKRLLGCAQVQKREYEMAEELLTEAVRPSHLLLLN